MPDAAHDRTARVDLVTLATEGLTIADVAPVRAWLSEDERRRADRFVHDVDRVTFTAAHALVRAVLSEHGAARRAEWRFRENRHGCPFVVDDQAGAPPLSFNLSHTTGLVAVAVTRGRAVGVDVERVDRAVTDGIAERHFAPAEVAALRRLPPALQARVFFEYWTLKEAYIKARGMGLAIPLDAFAFTLHEVEPPTVAFVDGFDDRADRWQFWQAWPTAAHRLSLAVERDGADVPVAARTVTLEALAS